MRSGVLVINTYPEVTWPRCADMAIRIRIKFRAVVVELQQIVRYYTKLINR
jgi:hypothetical protein